MELRASGFNAWNQLCFESGGVSEPLPRDLYAFKCILRDESIEFIQASLSMTQVRTSSAIRTAGHVHIELIAARNSDLSSIAIAGNGKIAEFRSSEIRQYDSPEAYNEGKCEIMKHEIGDILQLVANETTFTALSKDGKVVTSGDGRYENCLGREVSDQSPASTPAIVSDLLDLPTGSIRKISSGGYVTAALTEGNDLYVWGGRPGQENMLEELGGTPTPVDVQGHDVQDFAVGFDHVIVLTTAGELFVAGAGGNGQLGLGSVVEKTKGWAKVPVALEPGQKIKSVYAGYKNSFLVL